MTLNEIYSATDGTFEKFMEPYSLSAMISSVINSDLSKKFTKQEIAAIFHFAMDKPEDQSLKDFADEMGKLYINGELVPKFI